MEEISKGTGDPQAEDIYTYVGIMENLYKYEGNYDCNFFAGKNTGTIYLHYKGGTVGCGFYILENGVRTDTWRIGRWHSATVLQSTNGEDWGELNS